MRLVFLGPPGAGKGTQAELLWERRKVRALASGNILREAIRNGDPIGKEAARCMANGVLVPDRLVTDLILQRLQPLGPVESFVLDGFPRTVSQAQALDVWLKQRAQPGIDLAVDFEISADAIIRRLEGRRICKKCGANYHLRNLPPKREGMCDRCGGELGLRPDDDLGTIEKRLVVYHRDTEPLLKFYRDQNKLKVIQGDLDIETQYAALLDLLREQLA
ncbi:MAG: nucleoside monophosphate kinase [Candidatus Omnitrophica bacterium]|nr:nucleoside monophosphate kinase [Candidatus Omnitrophota bacterium]